MSFDRFKWPACRYVSDPSCFFEHRGGDSTSWATSWIREVEDEVDEQTKIRAHMAHMQLGKSGGGPACCTLSAFQQGLGQDQGWLQNAEKVASATVV